MTPFPEHAVLGTAYVYRALDSRRAERGTDGMNRLLASVPSLAASLDGTWRRTSDGYRILRSGPLGSAPFVWEAVAVGPAAREDAFDAWTWHVHRTGAPARFTRYLEGAARLHHQASVHRAHQQSFRARGSDGRDQGASKTPPPGSLSRRENVLPARRSEALVAAPARAALP